MKPVATAVAGLAMSFLAADGAFAANGCPAGTGRTTASVRSIWTVDTSLPSVPLTK